MGARQDPLERIYKHAFPEPMSGCWFWMAKCNVHGYGTIGVYGKTWLAHRASYVLHGGKLLPGQCVLHRCDMPSCVNPDHLFVGMPADNVRDMEQKKRAYHPRGQDYGRTHLSEDDVRAIRADARSATVLGRLHNMNPVSIRYIKQRKSWKHVL